MFCIVLANSLPNLRNFINPNNFWRKKSIFAQGYGVRRRSEFHLNYSVMTHSFRFHIFFIVFAIALLAMPQLQAQDVEKLPDDPRVRRGKLANGLSYILIKNGAESGKADFGVLQNIGTSIEGEGEKGMLKLLETLTMRGTRNFNDATILSYLKSIGVPATNIEFNTGVDNTVYSIKGVPVKSGNTVDSTLLILYNWLGSMNLDEEDLKEEIPFLRTRLANESTAEKRLNDALIKELYPKSNYYHSIGNDAVNSLAKISSKELRAFYYKWFRPELQCIAIAGDIDLDLMETKIKSLFVTIPKPLDKQKRTLYSPKEFEGVKVSVLTDKEYSRTKITVAILKEPILEKYRNTTVPYLQEYFDDIIINTLEGRLNSAIAGKNIAINNLDVKKGRFLDISNLEAFTISFETLPESAYAATSFIGTELENLAKNGLTPQEMRKNRDIYFKGVETQYDGRKSLPNSFYFNRIERNFFDGYTLASTEMKFEVLKEMVYAIPLSSINEYTQSLLNSHRNTLLSCFMPWQRNSDPLSKERLLLSYNGSALSAPVTIKESEPVVWPLIALGSTAPALLSESLDEVTASTVMHLSNGATVIFKNNPSSKDTIAFRAVSKGGYSLMKGVTPNMERLLNESAEIGGLLEMSKADIEKLFTYNNISISTRIYPQKEEIEGYAATSSAEKMMQAIYLEMTARRADRSAFDTYRKGYLYQVQTQSLDPEVAFRDSVEYYNVSNRNYVNKLDADAINSIDYNALFKEIGKRFSNAADWTFIFSGDYNLQSLKEYAVKYLGAIPGREQDNESSIVIPNYASKNSIQRRFLYKMVAPRSMVSVTYNNACKTSTANYILGNMVSIYLNEQLKLNRSGRMYSNLFIDFKLKSYPEELATMEISFETDSTTAQNTIDNVKGILVNVANGKLSNAAYKELVSTTRNIFLTSILKNAYWLDILEEKYLFGRDFHSDFMSSLETLSKDRFEAFVNSLIRKGNEIAVIMDGTTKDVNTQNLFKEEGFIKDYFNL